MFKRFDYVPDIHPGGLQNRCRAERAFWYDRLDDSTQVDTSDKAAWNRRQIETARAADLFRLRTGTLSRRKNPPLRQKEVDVLLVVEFLTHSCARNMRDAVLILDDLDFRPAIEEAARHGTITHLLYDPRGISQELLDSAHMRTSFELNHYLMMTRFEFRASHPCTRSLRGWARLERRTGPVQNTEISPFQVSRPRKARLPVWSRGGVQTNEDCEPSALLDQLQRRGYVALGQYRRTLRSLSTRKD